ncbi:MAG: baseplate assembly protein [Roseateles depolymerans]|uniref:Baseplate assembly protein n=1 Tax=Roseateles depolymerans TaxID=76731 RepID=A0A2W5DPM2_9BURK|nr:MAG: baseplate assembly protein [Roseateles depolymerans]
MSGMDRNAGRGLEGIAHLRQSIVDILATPIGSRIARRTYGSLLSELVDQPDNGATRVRIFAATAGALMRWEPRLRVSRITLDSGTTPGQLLIGVSGIYVPRSGPDQALQISVPLQFRAAV